MRKSPRRKFSYITNLLTNVANYMTNKLGFLIYMRFADLRAFSISKEFYVPTILRPMSVCAS